VREVLAKGAERRDKWDMRWRLLRTVEEQAESDGVDDDHHGHGGLALTFRTLGTRVMDDDFRSASEKGAHCCSVGRGRCAGRNASVTEASGVIDLPSNEARKNQKRIFET